MHLTRHRERVGEHYKYKYNRVSFCFYSIDPGNRLPSILNILQVEGGGKLPKKSVVCLFQAQNPVTLVDLGELCILLTLCLLGIGCLSCIREVGLGLRMPTQADCRQANVQVKEGPIIIGL